MCPNSVAFLRLSRSLRGPSDPATQASRPDEWAKVDVVSDGPFDRHSGPAERMEPGSKRHDMTGFQMALSIAILALRSGWSLDPNAMV
jgi:hypothetical protein